MVIYADAVFVLNTALNWMLLRSAAVLRGSAVRKWRLWLGAGIGGAYAVAVTLPDLHWLAGVGGKGLFLVLMVLAAFGFRRQTIASAAVFLLLSVVLCGAMYAVLTLLLHAPVLSGGFYPVTFPELLLTCALSAGGMVLVLRCTSLRAGEKTLPVTLVFGGRKLRLSAFRDTGNSLTDPFSGHTVPVVEAAALTELLGKQAVGAVARGDLSGSLELLAPYCPCLLPFRTVAAGGTLVTIRCDCLILNDRKHHQCRIALSPTPVSDRGDYCVLLGGNL